MKRYALLLALCLALPAYAGWDGPTDKAEDPDDEYVCMIDGGKLRNCYIVPREARQTRQIAKLEKDAALQDFRLGARFGYDDKRFEKLESRIEALEKRIKRQLGN